jgi:hypothetical protein
MSSNCTELSLVPGMNIIHHFRHEATGQVGYLLKHGSHGLRMADQLTAMDGTVYKPRQPSATGGLPFPIPSDKEIDALLIKPDGSTLDPNEALSGDYQEKLFDDVEMYIRKTVELPHKEDYLLQTSYVFHTYLIEHANASPIIYPYGVKESGKSRNGGVLGKLVFRGYHCTSITEAVLFRMSELFNPTFIIDEIDLSGKPGIRDMLKSRYSRGPSVARINDYKAGEEGIGIYRAFGPTAICTTEILGDIIESRTITFHMQKNSDTNRDIETYYDTPEAVQEAADLRARLTLFRANYYGNPLTPMKPIARRRLGEILNPLYQVVMIIFPEREDDFKRCVERVKRESKEMERSSLEADIIQVVHEYYDNTKHTFISTEHIASTVNNGRNNDERISTTHIGNTMKALSFPKQRSSSQRGYKIDTKVLDQHVRNYFGGDNS